MAYTKTFKVGLGDIVYRPTGNKYPSKWKVVYIGFSEAGTFYNLARLDRVETMSTEESRLGVSWFLTEEEAKEYIKKQGTNRTARW